MDSKREHKGGSYAQQLLLKSSAGSRASGRDATKPAALRDRNARRALSSYSSKHKAVQPPPQQQQQQEEEEQDACELSSARTLNIFDDLLDQRDKALQQELQSYELRLQQLKQQTRQRPGGAPQQPPRATEAAEQSVGRTTPTDGAGGGAEEVAVASAPAAASHLAAGCKQQRPSIVRQVVTATGQGCQAVLLADPGDGPESGACWTTRSHRLVTMESSCTLDLQPPAVHEDVCIRMAFACADVVPRSILLEHAPTPTAKFQALGEIRLQAKSLRQLRHLFRLGKEQPVQRVLRITCVGWLAREHAGMHKVSSLLVSGVPAAAGATEHGGKQLQAWQWEGHAEEEAGGLAWAAVAPGDSAHLRHSTAFLPSGSGPRQHRRCSSASAAAGPLGGPRPWARHRGSVASGLGARSTASALAGPARASQHVQVPASQQALARQLAQSWDARAGAGVAEVVIGVPVAGAVLPLMPQAAETPLTPREASAYEMEPANRTAAAGTRQLGGGMATDHSSHLAAYNSDSAQLGAPQQILPPSPLQPQQAWEQGEPAVPLSQSPVVAEVASHPPAAVPPKQQSAAMPAPPSPPPPPPPRSPSKKPAVPGPAPLSPLGAAGKAVPPPTQPSPCGKPGQGSPAKAESQEQALGASGDREAMPTPTRPMKKLFWSKLPASRVEGTLWSNLEGVPAEVDFGTLEEDFAAKAFAKELGSGASAPPCSAPPRVMLLPIQRSNNVGVFLKKLKLEPRQVKASILQLLGEDSPGARNLTDEEVGGLLACLPTEEEGRLLQGYTGSAADLAPVEQFMLEVLGIPELKSRLQALQFGAQFDSRAAWLQSMGTLLAEACREVRECTLLAEVLKLALLVGNFLNAGNRNGAAAGFQIDALLKLRDVKSSRSRSSTLLHFLAREVARQHPEGACSLKACLPSARGASRLDLAAVHSELGELAAGLRQVEGAAKVGAGCEAFAAGMVDFHARARDRLDKLVTHIAEAEEAFRHLGTFLNGQQSTMREPSALFAVLSAFADDLEAAHQDNIQADRAAPKKAQKTPLQPQAGGKQAVRGAEEASPMRQKDKVLSTIRAFGILKPDQRKAMLTDKGALERLKKHNIQRRHSVAGERPCSLSPVPAGTAGAASQQGPEGTRRPGPLAGTLEHAARASCPQGWADAARLRPPTPAEQPDGSPYNPRPSSSPAVLPVPGFSAGHAAQPEDPGNRYASRQMAGSEAAATGWGPKADTSPSSGGTSGGDPQDGSPGISAVSAANGSRALAAVAGDGAAQLHLSLNASVLSLPLQAEAAGGEGEGPRRNRGNGLARSVAAATLQQSRLAQDERPRLARQASVAALARSSSQQLLSPTSTPLAAMGGRRSSGALAPVALWRSCSGAIEQQQQQQQPEGQAAPAAHRAGEPATRPGQARPGLEPLLTGDGTPLLPPEQSTTPDCFAALAAAAMRESLTARPLSGTLAQRSREGLQRSRQQPQAASGSLLLSPFDAPQAPVQPHSDGSGGPCQGQPARMAAPRPTHPVSSSLPAVLPSGPAAQVPAGGAQRSSLDVERLVSMLQQERRDARPAQRIGQQEPPREIAAPPAAAAAAAVGGQPASAASARGSMERLLQHVPTPLRRPQTLPASQHDMQAQEQGAMEDGRGRTAPRYDPHVQRAMAQVLASAGSSPTGPLGQGIRASLPEFNPGGLRSSVAVPDLDLLRRRLQPRTRLSSPPAMPQPLGEGVRMSATLMPGAFAAIAQQEAELEPS